MIMHGVSQGRVSARLDGTRLDGGSSSLVVSGYPSVAFSNDAATEAGSAKSKRRTRGRAQTLEVEQVERVFRFLADTSRVPESDALKVAFTFFAGMRACEVAGLELRDVTDVDGRLSPWIRIRPEIAKSGRERLIPMHGRLADGIRVFQRRYPQLDRFAITRTGNRIRFQSTNSLCVWFHRLYSKMGLKGASSHSGRRTFITNLARNLHEHGGSIKDVQILAGHARLDTTEAYIEPSANLANLVSSIGSSGPSGLFERGRRS